MTTIQKAIAENKELQSQVDDFKAQKAQEIKKLLIEKAREVNGIKVIAGVVPLEPQYAKDIAFQLRTQFPERLLVAFGCAIGGKPTLTVALSDDLVAEGKRRRRPAPLCHCRRQRPGGHEGGCRTSG